MRRGATARARHAAIAAVRLKAQELSAKVAEDFGPARDGAGSGSGGGSSMGYGAGPNHGAPVRPGRLTSLVGRPYWSICVPPGASLVRSKRPSMSPTCALLRRLRRLVVRRLRLEDKEIADLMITDFAVRTLRRLEVRGELER